MARARVAHEIELKLVAQDLAVIDEIEQVEQLGPYRLRSGRTRAIRDRHFDLPGGDLGLLGIGLRIRSQDDANLFTVKWPRSLASTLFDRLELEVAVSVESWSDIRTTLQGQGVDLREASATGDDPVNWLQAAGLCLTQDRTTRRRIQWAALGDCDVAEIALDVTSYQIGIYAVSFQEVEIEALDSDETHVLALGLLLQQTFPGRLSHARIGKYGRGLHLAAMLEPVQPWGALEPDPLLPAL